MTTPNVNAKTSKLFFSLVAGSLLVAAPVIVMGCSGSTTAPFVAITPTPSPTPQEIIPVSPPAPAEPVASTYRLLIGISSDSTPPLSGRITAGEATFIPAGTQTVPGKTVFVPDLSSALGPIEEFSELGIADLEGGPEGTIYSEVCFEVENLSTGEIVAKSAACPP